MTLTDELKILDDKIEKNHVKYDLDREAAKISALSTKELDRYEYLTDKDLGYKPGVAEEAKFEQSSLDLAIKDQAEKQIQMLTNKTDKKVDFKNVSFKSKMNFESAKVYNEIKEENKKIDFAKLVCIGSGTQHHYKFTIFLG